MNQKIAKVEKLNMRGMGIVHCEGRRIPVPGSIEGEIIRFELIPKERNRVIGRILEVVHPSINRTNPCCDKFPGCPGCHIRHLQYESQRDFAFQRIAFVSARDPSVPVCVDKTEFLSIPHHTHYRIRCSLSPALVRNRVIMGMKSHYPDQPFVDLSKCPNHHPNLNHLISKVANFFNQDSIVKESVHFFRNIQFYLILIS